MKAVSLFSSLFAVCLSLVPAPSALAQTDNTVVLDRIVAVVNDDVILDSELDAFLRTVKAQLRRRGTNLPPDNVLRRQALEKMILRRIQLQLAEQTGIRVDDDTVNRAVRSVAGRNNLTVDQFRRVLERDGFSFVKFREDLRHEIMVARLQRRNVDSRIQISEREVDRFLANREAFGQEDLEYKLSHILVAVPQAASPEKIQAAREKAERALSRVNAGTDFAQVAASMSDGQRALQGGNLGWFPRGRLPSAFVDTVVGMEAGAVSELIRSPSGFHIVKVDAVRGSTKHVVEQTRVRQILLRTNDLLSDHDARTRLEQLRQRALGGADFGDLARSHSDHTLSARKGGDLGWLGPGELIPPLEKAVSNLGPGEISEPIRTPHGWHLLQVLERRKHDSTEKFRRAKAQEVLRERKRQEALELWLRRLRDQAYVEYRLKS